MNFPLQKLCCMVLLFYVQANYCICTARADSESNQTQSKPDASEPNELTEASTKLLDGHVSEEQSKAEADQFRKLQYGVIGVRLMQSREHQPEIVEVYPTCPAAIAGIRPGDQVMKANDHVLSGMEAQKEFWKIVTGKPDTPVDLTILRDGQVLVIRLMRMNIEDIEDADSRKHYENLLRRLGRVNH